MMGMIFPLLALSILVFGALGVTWLLTQGRSQAAMPPGGRDVDLLREAVQDLQLEMDAVRGELAEVQERLDFTERLLARSADAPPGRLTSGGAAPPPAAE